MAKVPNDYELDFLKTCTKEELEPLVGILLGTNENGEIDLSGRISSELEAKAVFKDNYPDHTKYVDEIIEEIQTYGGNTFANMFRGYGVDYHELLCDAAKKSKVNFNRSQATTMVEDHLLAKVLEEAWNKMPEEDRKKLMRELGNQVGNVGGAGYLVLINIFRAGGFKSYQLALIIVNAIAKAIFGRGLALVGNAALCRGLAILAGPIGWVLGGLWAALDVASPAFRVTVPACTYIAALRKMKENEKYAQEAESEA